jgi:hypothetical protein
MRAWDEKDIVATLDEAQVRASRLEGGARLCRPLQWGSYLDTE